MRCWLGEEVPGLVRRCSEVLGLVRRCRAWRGGAVKVLGLVRRCRAWRGDAGLGEEGQ